MPIRIGCTSGRLGFRTDLPAKWSILTRHVVAENARLRFVYLNTATLGVKSKTF